MGLYQGLRLQNVTPEDFHKWRIECTLISKIKEIFYNIPEQNRGGYFPWFLEHTYVLHRQIDRQEAIEKMVATFFNQAQSYLDPADRNLKQDQLKPEAKADCYVMLAHVLHATYPNPVKQNWYNFGFCTCRNESEASRLGGLYQQLLVGNKLLKTLKGVQVSFFRGICSTRLQRSPSSGMLTEMG